MLTLSLVTLAATAAPCRRALESWAAPGALLALFWLVQVVPGLLGDGRDVPALGVAWIALSCLAFAIGGAVGQAVAGGMDEPGPPPLTLPAAEATMIVGTLLGLGFLAIRTVTVGPSWSYSGDDDVPMLLKPVYAAQFATPALGGMALAVGGSRRRTVLALATLAPAVATLLLSTRRTVLLLALLHAAGGYLAARAWVDRGRVRPFSGRRLALMVPAAAFLVAAVFVAAAVRVRLTGREANLGDFAASAFDGLDLPGPRRAVAPDPPPLLRLPADLLAVDRAELVGLPRPRVRRLDLLRPLHPARPGRPTIRRGLRDLAGRLDQRLRRLPRPDPRLHAARRPAGAGRRRPDRRRRVSTDGRRRREGAAGARSGCMWRSFIASFPPRCGTTSPASRSSTSGSTPWRSVARRRRPVPVDRPPGRSPRWSKFDHRSDP